MSIQELHLNGMSVKPTGRLKPQQLRNCCDPGQFKFEKQQKGGEGWYIRSAPIEPVV
jgi:hypothetical protein